MKLLNIDNNAKTVKGLKYGWKTAILYLSPGAVDICPFASEGCRRACLNTAGRGRMNCVQMARRVKTEMYRHNKLYFFNRLVEEIHNFEKHYRGSNNLCVRLNGTSDIDFREVRKLCTGMKFYDYTKSFLRCIIKKFTEPDYDLTYSFKETDKTWKLWLARLLHIRTAVVFFEVPKVYKGIRVVPGDESDLRFLDPKTVIVGLKAKGQAKKDLSGFVK